MNSSAEVHVALGAAIVGVHLDAGTASSPAQPAAPAHDPLAAANAEIARLTSRLAAQSTSNVGFEALARRVDVELKRIEANVATELQSLESDVVSLALAAAGKVLRREIVSPSFDLGAVVHEALDRIASGLRSDRPVRVRASSHDVQLLDRSTRNHPVAGERVQIEVDPKLGPAQVVLECDLRRVVVDVRAEFERLKATLLSEDDPHA